MKHTGKDSNIDKRRMKRDAQDAVLDHLLLYAEG